MRAAAQLQAARYREALERMTTSDNVHIKYAAMEALEEIDGCCVDVRHDYWCWTHHSFHHDRIKKAEEK